MEKVHIVNGTSKKAEMYETKPETLNLCNIMSSAYLVLKQFPKLMGENRMQYKRMRREKMQIKPTLNVKLTLNVN